VATISSTVLPSNSEIDVPAGRMGAAFDQEIALFSPFGAEMKNAPHTRGFINLELST
jgi:hypothetical protein